MTPRNTDGRLDFGQRLVDASMRPWHDATEYPALDANSLSAQVRLQ